MPYSVYHVIHIIAVMLLVGIVFWALSDPSQEKRKAALKWSGICSIVALLAGFGLITKINMGFPLWIIVKIICWLILTGLVGVAYKNPEKKKELLVTTIALVTIAVVMVSLKPF